MKCLKKMCMARRKTFNIFPSSIQVLCLVSFALLSLEIFIFTFHLSVVLSPLNIGKRVSSQ